MKIILTLDVETTHKEKRNGGHTPLPYFGNRLVSVGYKYLGSLTNYLCFYHSTKKSEHGSNEILQDALNNAEVLVGHNIKFDICWLRECGFIYDGDLYDTMVAEYILAKSRRWGLSLDALSQKYDVTRKKKDLTEEYLKNGKTFYDIPYEIVEEYGIADVQATEEVALKQLTAFGTTFEELYDTDSDTKTVT